MADSQPTDDAGRAAHVNKPSFWEQLLERLGLLRLPAPVPIPVPATSGVRRIRRG